MIFFLCFLQEALDTCTKHVRELVDERIYILARMSNTREALRLITSENYDIHKAVEFCKVSYNLCNFLAISVTFWQPFARMSKVHIF